MLARSYDIIARRTFSVRTVPVIVFAQGWACALWSASTMTLLYIFGLRLQVATASIVWWCVSSARHNGVAPLTNHERTASKSVRTATAVYSSSVYSSSVSTPARVLHSLWP